MDKKEKVHIKLLLFVVVGIVLFQVITIILTPDWNYPIFVENTGMSIDELETMKDNPSVIFLGTSHMEYGVMPMNLYAQNGLITYNAATSGQCIEVTDCMVREIFDIGLKPKVIVIDAGSLFFEGEDYSYKYVSDNLNVSFKNRIILTNNYIAHIKKKSMEKDNSGEMNALEEYYKAFLGEICKIYKYHSRWDDINADDFDTNAVENYFSQGGFVSPYMYGTSVSQEDVDYIVDLSIDNQGNGTQLPESSDNVDDEKYYVDTVIDYNLRYLEVINDLCKKNNCQLLVIKVPVRKPFGDYKSSWSYKRYESVKYEMDKRQIPFVDLTYDINLSIDWMHDTGDGGAHLNLLGAEKVTDYLGQYILDNYDIQPHESLDYYAKSVLYDKYTEIAHINLSYKLTDYLERISASDHDLAVILSAKDDMISGLSQEEKLALNGLGFQTAFDEMQYNYSFIGVSDDGVIGYEDFSNRRQKYETTIETANGNENVAITSAGYLDGNISSIMINGQEYSLNQRGINFVVIDKESGLVVDRAYCDTCHPEHEVIHDVGYLLFEYQEFLLERK